MRLPRGDAVRVVDVHFDWVADDGFRFAQASALAEQLAASPGPYVVLGDFNDSPGSRTLGLFRELAIEAVKDGDQRLTLPSPAPASA